MVSSHVLNTVTEAEAKMFAASAGYERFMGRWSRLLAPLMLRLLASRTATACSM